MLRRAEVYGITFEELCQGLEVEAVLLHGPGHLLPPAAGAGQQCWDQCQHSPDEQVPHALHPARRHTRDLLEPHSLQLYIRFVVDNV